MIQREKELKLPPNFKFNLADLREVTLGRKYDVVLSGLTLHFVEDIKKALQVIAGGIRDKSAFVSSVLHPIRTSNLKGGRCEESESWIVRGYCNEGPRKKEWFGREITYFHRTIGSWFQVLTMSGFKVTQFSEEAGTAACLSALESI
jgi:hypothetical protein